MSGRRMKAWVLKRKYLDEHTGEVAGTLLYFRDSPPEYGGNYEWIRMEHLDERGADESGELERATDHPGRY